MRAKHQFEDAGDATCDYREDPDSSPCGLMLEAHDPTCPDCEGEVQVCFGYRQVYLSCESCPWTAPIPMEWLKYAGLNAYYEAEARKG